MGQVFPWAEKASLVGLAALQDKEPQKNIEAAVPSPPGSSGHSLSFIQKFPSWTSKSPRSSNDLRCHNKATFLVSAWIHVCHCDTQGAPSSTEPAEEVWREQRLYSLGQLQFRAPHQHRDWLQDVHSSFWPFCYSATGTVTSGGCRPPQTWEWLGFVDLIAKLNERSGRLMMSLHLIALVLSSHSLQKLCFCNY